jgi:DNA-directed RNA polymerase subunit L
MIRNAFLVPKTQLETLQLKVTSIKEREVSIEVEDEDIAIAQIVHKELLTNDNVTFAGVAPYHPLIKKSIIKLHTEKGDPIKVFIEGAEQAAATAKKISSEISKAVKT